MKKAAVEIIAESNLPNASKEDLMKLKRYFENLDLISLQ